MFFEFMHNFIIVEGGSLLMLGVDKILVSVVIRGNSKIQRILTVRIWTKLPLVIVIIGIRIHNFTFSILLPCNGWYMPIVTYHFKFVRGCLTWSHRMANWSHFHMRLRELKVIGMLFWTINSEEIRSWLIRKTLWRPILIQIWLKLYWVIRIWNIVFLTWITIFYMRLVLARN